MQSPSEENYLKVIYLLCQQDNKKVSATILATILGNNPASVVEMLKKLTEKKLIEYNKTKGVELTKSGEKVALMMVRKHRLWEMFLQEKLGYTWDEVHDIAEQLEHVKGSNLADRLDHFLGFPQFDPHGEPIPASSGQVPGMFSKTLNDVEVGAECLVVSVKDTSKSFLQYAHTLNIGIGSIIKVTSKIEFDESMTIIIGTSNETTVSRRFTENVYVK